MFTATRDKALLTTTTGALPRPSWYTENLRGLPLSRGFSQSAYREQHFDCLAANVAAQHRAGIDIMVDGDTRLDDDVAGRSWVAYVCERVEGIGEPRIEVQPAGFMADKQPGDDVKFTVIHEGRTKEYSVTLEAFDAERMDPDQLIDTGPDPGQGVAQAWILTIRWARFPVARRGQGDLARVEHTGDSVVCVRSSEPSSAARRMPVAASRQVCAVRSTAPASVSVSPRAGGTNTIRTASSTPRAWSTPKRRRSSERSTRAR